MSGLPALVTGANSGIGRAVAIALGDAGANVAVNYVSSPGEADVAVKQIEARGAHAGAIHADVSKEDDVKAMFPAVLKEFGTIHILCNNAGLQQDVPLDETS